MLSENWKNESLEWQKLWNHASALIAYTSITPLFYSGTLTGSEFETYSADKLYICRRATIMGGSYSFATAGYVDFYDESNVKILAFHNMDVYWDATAAAPKYTHNLFEVENFYFSRLIKAGYGRIIFNGYRLDV